jgi:hypothetical protein
MRSVGRGRYLLRMFSISRQQRAAVKAKKEAFSSAAVRKEGRKGSHKEVKSQSTFLPQSRSGWTDYV